MLDTPPAATPWRPPPAPPTAFSSVPLFSSSASAASRASRCSRCFLVSWPRPVLASRSCLRCSAASSCSRAFSRRRCSAASSCSRCFSVCVTSALTAARVLAGAAAPVAAEVFAGFALGSVFDPFRGVFGLARSRGGSRGCLCFGSGRGAFGADAHRVRLRAARLWSEPVRRRHRARPTVSEAVEVSERFAAAPVGTSAASAIRIDETSARLADGAISGRAPERRGISLPPWCSPGRSPARRAASERSRTCRRDRSVRRCAGRSPPRTRSQA